MYLVERIHMMHRVLRYRLRSERAELRYLLGRQFCGGSLLDVGAHRGVYSYWMHRRFRDLPVVAFEPQPELVEFLSDLKKTFHLERLVIAPVGLSSHSGTLQLHRASCHWGGATFDRSSYQLKGDEHDIFDVPVTTIDDFVCKHPELGPVRFIKCDVEYHEDDVIAGAERTLLEDRPELLVEWTIRESGRRQRLFSRMQKLGYSIFQFEYGRLTPCNSAERDAPHSRKLGGNYLLLPRERATSAVA